MNVEEIVNRKNQTFTVEEQVFVIAEYIRRRKGRLVKANPYKPVYGLPDSPLKTAVIGKIHQQVQSAFQDAQTWLVNN